MPLPKAYRLLNHGPTVLVSATHGGQRQRDGRRVEHGARLQPLQGRRGDRQGHIHPRGLIEASGRFALNVPSRGIAAEVLAIGNTSGRDLDHANYGDKFGLRAANLRRSGQHAATRHRLRRLAPECTLIPEPHNQQRYDLFIGEVTAAWGDSRVFVNGHWNYGPDTPAELQTLHYVAGGAFLSVAMDSM